MRLKYLRAERLLRASIDKVGDVDWSYENNVMQNAYEKLVDIFGNNLSSNKKSSLIKIMKRNSGFSDAIVFEDGFKPPMTRVGMIKGNPEHSVAICIYPTNVKSPSYIHEGVHFLGNYGPKKQRIIKKDIPLAKILDAFFTLRGDLSEFEKMSAGIDKRTIQKVVRNPFLDRYREHSAEETNEALLTALNAYLISETGGEKAGIDYILNLIEKANKNGQIL